MQFSRYTCLLSVSLVGSSGLEPPTSRLSGARSNQLSYEPMIGGDERVRTDGLLLARQALSQLSYTPTGHAVVRFVLPYQLFEDATHLQNYIVQNDFAL